VEPEEIVVVRSFPLKHFNNNNNNNNNNHHHHHHHHHRHYHHNCVVVVSVMHGYKKLDGCTVKMPQYSIRLEAVRYLYTSCLLPVLLILMNFSAFCKNDYLQ